jgi:6-phosphogluconolactonase (cycloisomerase 2 family)
MLAASFEVSDADATLSLLANTPSGGNMPWTMTWAENGDFLIVQNQHEVWDGPDGGVNDGTNGSGDGGLTIFPVEHGTGALGEPTKAVALPHCMAVTVVQQPPKPLGSL